MTWLAKLFGASAEPTGCSCSASSQSTLSRPEASPPRAPEVPPTSPAILLAKSMTDEATRGEWVADNKPTTSGFTYSYVNKKRDITVSRYVGYGYSGITTPFTLSKDEEEIVRIALIDFQRLSRADDERAALARLAAPVKKCGTKP